MTDKRAQSGNVFFTLFGAVGLVGIIGASTMTLMKGPVRSMHNVTQRTIAENNMIAAGKLALMAATNQALSGDCDADGTVEPVPFSLAGTGPFPTGAGICLTPSALLNRTLGVIPTDTARGTTARLFAMARVAMM